MQLSQIDVLAACMPTHHHSCVLDDIIALATQGFTICGRDVFQPGLQGIVRSPGYNYPADPQWTYLTVQWPHLGLDNKLTYLNVHWEPGHPNERTEDGRSVVIWCLKEWPNKFNPLYSGDLASAAWPAWKFLNQVFDPLVAVNPYNLNDIPWIATDWEVVETPPGGIDITYHLRDDVFWQDGLQYTAWDAQFSLEFMKDNEIDYLDDLGRVEWHPPPPWYFIEDVEVTNDYTFTVHANVTGWPGIPPDTSLFYHDYAICATLLPPQVWAAWNGLPLEQILERNLAAESGWNGATPTNLFGTGPFIFQSYDYVNHFGDLWANQNYFMTATEVQASKANMFWEAGDYNKDGLINVVDLVYVSLAYGSYQGEPNYDPDADFNTDAVVDMRDLSTVTRHLAWKREYP